MDSTSKSNTEDVHDSLSNLNISEGSNTPLADAPIDPNPWQDKPADILQPTKLTGADNTIGAPAESSLPSAPEPTHTTEEVLHDFDPLEQGEEQAAREAWSRSEGHPPPPSSNERANAPTPDPTSPEPPPKDKETPQVQTHPPSTPPPPETPKRGSGSNFPSLASLARSFSIPTLPRPRPVSIDTAKAVPSPTTLSSFASQQQQQQPSHDPELSSAVSRSGTPGGSGSGTASPKPGRSDKDKEPVFDFQKFLDQMKMKQAEPVAKYLRSFLGNFAKRTFTVNDQVKIINDFLNFISGRMRETDIWRNATEVEFDNAMEGMEKLVMNRLYEFTFTPQIARMVPPRPVTADDLERDRVLSQRIGLFGWVEETHLDIPEGEGSKGFLMFAQQELMKINHYKAPRDKLICILNSCKVIFGLIRHLHKDEGADSFVPILIFVVLKANPQHLLSNVEFINRFRNPAKLQSEAGYYLSSLMGAVSFIETMDHTSLSNITQEQFESNVEEAIQALPHSEPMSPSVSAPSTPKRALLSIGVGGSRSASPAPSPHAGEESAQPLALPTPGQTLGEDARRLLSKTGDTISKPLSAIGRIFSEVLDEAEGALSSNFRRDQPDEIGQPQPQQAQGQAPHWSDPEQVGKFTVPQTPIGVGEGGQQVGSYGAPIQTPYKPRVRRGNSPSIGSQSPGFAPDDTPTRGPWTNQPLALGPSQSIIPPSRIPPRVQSLSQSSSQHVSRTPTPNLDIAGMQEQIDQAHDKALGAARETLVQIFPGTDNEVIEWVLEANDGDLGKSIEGLLEMSSAS